MLYKDGRQTVEVLSSYLYELSIYVFYKNRSELLESKFYSSNKPLKIKKDVKTIKKTKDYKVISFLELLGAPQTYMESKGFKLAE